jgi:raffinose/stachyose/melibiose transport system substrate-binding protein
MKSIRFFTVLLGCLLCVFASCSKKAEVSGPVTIEFFQQKMEEGPQRGYQAVIDKFNAEFTGKYRIEMNTVPQAGTVLTSRVVSGDVPPLFSDYPTQVQFKEKVKNGIPFDLSGQSFLSRVNPPALAMSKAPDGHDYAMPLSHNFMGVYYNIDLFQQHGVAVPKTYAEFIAACKTFKAAGLVPISMSFADPGRVGHMFQTMNVAWSSDGVERIVDVMSGQRSVEGDQVLMKVAQRVLEVVSYGNEDAFGLPDTGMWEAFANGRAAMCITGSYARGTIFLANPNLNAGVFPLPNDTEDSTTLLTGIDAALCVSARANPAQQEAALAFLEYISRPENAQTFCDSDGAPSNITAVVYSDSRLSPVIDKMKVGPLHDWFASFIPGNVQSEIYNVVQQFLIEKNAAKFLQELQKAIVAQSAK